MANQMMGEGMMDSSYSNAPVSPPDKAPADKAPGQSVDEQNAGETQILVSKKELPPATKEGDVCSFKVSKDTGDEFILEYVKEGQEEQGEPPTKDNFDATTDKELSALDSQGNQ
ncbi:MAG TPA: hypothetical protein VMQ76_06930 [Terracidiphilus sp.]|nr:hypothetical protein [Terracidiphilus sp.]